MKSLIKIMITEVWTPDYTAHKDWEKTQFRLKLVITDHPLERNIIFGSESALA